jgi:hypothetical protein
MQHSACACNEAAALAVALDEHEVAHHRRASKDLAQLASARARPLLRAHGSKARSIPSFGCPGLAREKLA